jgi:hypothetical protein
MAKRPPLARDEVQRVLARLSPLAVNRKIVLIGGQAVAWWTYFLELDSEANEVEIFTSEDIDFEGAARSAQLAADLIGGKVHLPDRHHVTPSTGQVIFRDSAGFKREIDFIGSPIGLDPTDVRSSAVPLSIPDAEGGSAEILVMHPERCLESRVHNVIDLGTTGPIAMTQLERSIACAREWSRYLLSEGSLGERKRIRAVLDLNERIYRKCIHSQAFRRLPLEHGVEPFEAVLVDDRLPGKFRDRRYPQMAEAIEVSREKARKHRERYSTNR